MSIRNAFKTDPQQIRVSAEQNRLNEQARLDRELQALELGLQRHRTQTAIDRERNRVAAEIRAEKSQARAERTKHLRQVGQTIGRRGLIIGPILSPMAVAWVGQIQFAQGTLNWPLAGALVFAASWELTTAFSGWMYHQARSDGDAGTIFRAATWMFALSAGAMNYWHALGEGHQLLSPTPKAVAYGAMSIVGIMLWELYALLIHRQGLRAAKKLPEARPKFGLARWLRFPQFTFRAWSAAIQYGLATTDEAWTQALTGPRVRRSRRPQRGSWTVRIFGREVFAAQASEPQSGTPALPLRDLSRVVDLPIPKLRTSTDLWWLTRSQTSTPDPIRSETRTPDRSTDGSDTQVPTWVLDLIKTQVSDLTPAGPAAQQTPDPTASDQVQNSPTQTGPKKQTRTRTKPLDRIEEARSVDASYFADHGRHIPAEKLARAMEIGKPAALELVKQVRGAQMAIAK